jgi:hypothetical protein
MIPTDLVLRLIVFAMLLAGSKAQHRTCSAVAFMLNTQRIFARVAISC